MEYSFAQIILIPTAVLLILLFGPLVFDRCVGIEQGKYRIAYCRYGYSFQFDWRHNGYSKTGFWPWDRWLRPDVYKALNK